MNRASLFTLPATARRKVYEKQLFQAELRHAKWAARRYAATLKAEGTADKHGVYHGRYRWDAQDAFNFAGGDAGIRNTMQNAFRVKPEYLNYATMMTSLLLREEA